MKAEWSGKTKGRNFGQKFLFRVLAKHKSRRLYPVVHIALPFYMIFNPKAVKGSYRFYRNLLEYSRIKSLRCMRRNFITFGKVILDKFAVWAGNTRQFDIHFENEELFTHLTQSDKGFLVASAHIGNFEMAATTMQYCRKPINIIFWGNESELIIQQRLTSFNKTGFQVNIIRIGNDLSYIFDIKNALSRGEIVITNCDRFAIGQRRTKARFFGKDVSFPTGIFHIASSLEVPMLFISTLKGRGQHYNGYVSELITDTLAKRNEKCQRLVQHYASLLEEKVREAPLQWFNFYDFMKN